MPVGQAANARISGRQTLIDAGAGNQSFYSIFRDTEKILT